MRNPIVVALSVLASVTSGCGFDSAVPDDAVVLCRSDDECPTGERCDLFQHVCRAELSPPRVLDVALTPAAAATGVVVLAVRADVPLVAVEASLQGASAPSFVAQGDAASTRTLTADVTDVAEGVYPLVAIEVSDEEGERTRQELVGQALVVDRTPPRAIDARLVSPPTDLTYSDAAGANEIEVRALASEPLSLDGAQLSVGSLSSTDCDTGDGNAITCRLEVVAGELSDGPVSAVMTVRDAAGNSGSAEVPLVIDTAAPQVVPDSVSVGVFTGARATDVASPSSLLTISFVATEDLGADPIGTFSVAGTDVPLELVARAGRQVTFRRAGALPAAPGVWPVRVELSDRFGHVSAPITLSLPPPFADGIPIQVGAASCEAAPGQCVDKDGDGHSAVTTCTTGDDPDDTDATVYPGALEVPGDGKDNNGIAGDLPITDATGVFVDSEAGSDAADGTRATPVATLDRAAQRAAETGLVRLYLAARATPYTATSFVELDVIGGLDPTTWEHSALGSVVDAAVCGGPRLIVGIETEVPVVACPNPDGSPTFGTVLRSRIADLGANSSLVVFSEIGVLGGQDQYLIDSTVASIDVVTLTLVRSIVANGARVRGSVVAISSVLVGSSGAALHSDGGTATRVFGSTLIGNGNSPVVVLFGGDFLQIVGSSLLNPGSINTIGLVLVEAVELIANNLPSQGGGALLRSEGTGEVVLLSSVAELEACGWEGCVNAEGNLAEIVPIDPRLAPGSPLIDASVDLFAHGAPPSAIADLDGACRDGPDLPDIGADEL